MAPALMKRLLCCEAAGCSLGEVFMLEGTLSAADHRGSSTDSLIPACSYLRKNNVLPLLKPDNHRKPASQATLHLPLHLPDLSSSAQLLNYS